jgi:hypothetical protein
MHPGNAPQGHAMMIWLWDAYGPVRTARGITDDRDRAITLAETCLSSGQAAIARVEGAVLILGTHTLTSGYRRTGEGWRGRCGDSGIQWEPFTPTQTAAS